MCRALQPTQRPGTSTRTLLLTTCIHIGGIIREKMLKRPIHGFVPVVSKWFHLLVWSNAHCIYGIAWKEWFLIFSNWSDISRTDLIFSNTLAGGCALRSMVTLIDGFDSNLHRIHTTPSRRKYITMSLPKFMSKSRGNHVSKQIITHNPPWSDTIDLCCHRITLQLTTQHEWTQTMTQSMSKIRRDEHIGEAR